MVTHVHRKEVTKTLQKLLLLLKLNTREKAVACESCSLQFKNQGS